MFNKFNTIQYPIEINGKTVYKTVKDITTNIRPDPKILNDYVNFNPRKLIDGETFEITANEEYENPNYHYLVMIANNRYDWRNDRPLTQNEFETMISEKYAGPNNVHHFEDLDGNIVDNIYNNGSSIEQSYPKNVIPITNREYEQRLNDATRDSRVIKPEYVSTAVTIVESKVKENSDE